MSTNDRLARLRSLSPEQHARLMAAMRARGADAPGAAAGIPRLAPGAAAPLSYAQERLAFLEQLSPGDPAYNIPRTLLLEGPLDAAALERALGALVERHAALRTVFVPGGDGAQAQRVDAAAAWTLETGDLSALPPEAAQAEARARAAAEAATGFDLQAGPLFRARLLRMDAERHLLTLVVHHAVSDGWSMGVLFRDLSALYAAFRRGLSPALPELPVTYADYAAWQRAHLAGGAMETQLAYWRETLRGAPAVLELPTERPRPAVRTGRGGRVAFSLGAPLSAAVQALAQREGATLYMVGLAAFHTLLARLSGQDDVCVGSPIAGRTRPELEGVVGCFVNTLVLRGDLSGDPTFRELLGRVRESTLAAYAHQDVPFERLVEELSPERSLGHTPLFQVMFSLQNNAGEERTLDGVAVRPLTALAPAAKFDMTLTLAEREDGVRGVLEYALDLFDEAAAARLAAHFTLLLQAAAADPALPVSRLPLLTPDERRRAVVEWNPVPRPIPGERLLHRLVEAQGARTPNAVAVIHEERSLTCAELDGRAARLAGFLAARGVGPGVRVGICLERGVEMVVAILAVLKAGGAYVPLEPSHPAERIAGVLADAAAPVLLTVEQTAARIGDAVAAAGVETVRMDGDEGRIAAEGAGAVPRAPSPADAAYVIYTSGSTGTPKGVVVEHRQITGYLHGVMERLAAVPCGSFALVSTVAADLGHTVLFPALCTGGVLHVVSEERATDPDAFAAYMDRHAVECMKIVPSHLQALQSGARPFAVLPRRLLILGGEASKAEWIESLRQGAPGLSILNHYGPTETTVGVLTSPIPSRDAAGAAGVDVGAGGAIPLGRPLSGTAVYLLDRHLEPVPTGVAGEVYVGGATVARGYLGRPALTAEKFVPDPFGTAGARLYRTGDLARYRRDGAIEFLGRIDHQVKIRGFRVELGEIESALLRLPGVRETVVLAREDAAGDRRLVAYVVPAGAAAPEPGVLRTALLETLPEYMVPAAFVALERLPLTRNGKVDRRALPAPDAGARPVRAYEAPRTPTEEVLAGVWAQVLRLERVGRDDPFFELGGHSLLATRVVSRVRQLFACELPLRALFEAPTVAGLAARIDEAVRTGSTGSAVPPLVPSGLDGPAPLSFAQERLWVLDQMEPGSAAYNIPAALRLRGALDVAALERALSEIVRRHQVLRSVFRAVDGRPVQTVMPHVPLALEVEELSALDAVSRAAVVRRRAEEEGAMPFDLAAGPPLRARLLRAAADEHVLLLTVHHVVSDGWSRGVLFGELAALYGAYSRGQASPLAEPAVQYADFAVWQRGWLRGEVLDAQMAWWKEQLRGAPALLELPTDRPRPALQSYRGARRVVPLDPAVMERLEALGRQEGATPFMTLLAAWQLLLFRYSGQDDVVVGSPIAGRTRAETEPLIGCFVNTLALRGDLSGDPGFRALLGRVRETTLGAYAHQDLPFERLVDEVAPERSLALTPVFQTVFVLQNAVEGVTELPGLTLSGVEREMDTAKFDLTLTAGRMGGGWGAALEYSTDLYDAATAERMLSHFGILLASIAADPDAPVGALAMLSAGERRHVTETVNARRVFSAAPCLHQIFAERAARTPDAVALTCAGDSLTYRELDERSNQLARHLRARGVGPEVRVGLCLERSMEMVVSILGVLKAGGAYVPLDPFYPAERLAFQVEDSGIPVLLTQSSVRDVLPENGAEVICLDVDWSRIAAESAEPVESGAGPDALAYVIYTSGSTGKPKGVLVTHANAVRLFTATDEWFGFGADDVWTLFHSYAFDFSVWEIWGALLYGGRLVVVPFEVSRSPEAFYALLETEGVTVLNQTPSAFRQLMRVDEEAAARGEMRPLALRNVVFGGEALDPASLRGWVSRRGVDAPRLVNMYGITETTVHVTYRVITREDVENGGGSPIGVAIPDLSVYVLDAKGQPVPVGVPGELYVGGAGVARGYLNRPELTAERFIDSPFVTGERLYRSGDRVRWLADGGLEYLGRIDQQVKIRGFRIELGEIEAALQQHDAVREAVVIAREDVPGDRRLVGYVVGTDVGTAELRRHLLESLPDYMVPAALVFLAELPLTRNGKVDKRALPAPDANRAELEEAYVAPRSATEATLAEVWADVLRVERVGVEDNFFELGGDSILAIQVIARAQQRGLRLTPKQIFQHQTVAGLAAVAGTAAVAEAEQGIVAGPVKLTPIQTWFFARQLPDPHHYNQSMLLRIRDRVDAAVLERALAALLAHHDALRLRFRRGADGSWTQENAGVPAEVPFDVVDVSALPESDRAAAVEAVCAERQASLDLVRGPILRAVLFEGDAWEPQRLFIAVHHLAVDGVSWRILLEDLETALGQLSRGQAVALPAKTTSYRQWAERLAGYAASDALRGEMEHWTAAERDAAAPLRRDLDGACTADSVRTLGLSFDEDETRALLQDVPAAYHTQINDVLLAALAQALTGWTGGRAVAVTLEGHGREDLFEGVDLSRTTGWFTSLFPVVLPAPVGGPGDHLKRVKELLRDVPTRGVGYGVLRHLCPDARVRERLAALPAPEVAFNYLGQFDGTLNDEAMFAPAPVRRGPDHAATGRPAHLIEINGNVRGGRLVLGWSYSAAVHAPQTVQRLADAYAAALRALIEHCLSPQAGGYTPSDFAAAGLSQEELDDLMAELSET
jgi:amino acid adenylation domain-containing protein/non-ribosomal peptide synthase protein (TIGR01720 family)